MSGKGKDLVPNPMHAELSKLHAQLQRDAPAMSNALKAADQQMSGGGTWLGPAAQSWGSELDGHSRDCASQVNAMLADVAQALQNAPAQVTSQEAAQQARLMANVERGY